LPEGHVSYYTTLSGPDILHNVIVTGCVTFYQMNKYFLNLIIFSLLTKSLWPDEKWFRGSDGLWKGFAGRRLEAPVLTYSWHSHRDYFVSICAFKWRWNNWRFRVYVL